jgi:hypothetical protein
MTTPSESKTFYNVMPEVTGTAVAKPTVTTTPPAGNGTAPKPPLTIPSHNQGPNPWLKWAVIGAGALLILGALGYGAYWYLNSNDDTTAENSATDEIAPMPTEAAEVTTPADWLARHFGAETCTELVICGDKADPDRDGLDNLAEFNAGTGPNNPDSDSDGLADGDEVNVFNTDPLLSRTYREGEYTDLDFVKGGYDISTNAPYTNERIFDIKSKIKQYGLHQPTLSSLGTLSFQLYEFTDPNLPPLPANLDLSPEAKLDRDSQRQSTTKKVGAALLKYREDKKSFPPTDDYVIMADMVKPYNTVATNYNDPINIQPYVYGYQATDNNANFTLSYYSETQNQLIKYYAKNAEEDAAKNNTQVYDDQRKIDLENIQLTLKTYSLAQLDPASDKEFVFPPADGLKAALIPKYMVTMPTDPVTKQDYLYEVGPTFDTFTIRAALQNPPAGTTGYMCNQTECKSY